MEKKENTFLHLIVQQMLQEKMAALPYMSPIPSERELCEEYSVSRPTIRKALSELEQAGLLTRIHGRGSFYIGNKLSIDYSGEKSNGLGLTQVFTSTGKVIRSRVLQQVAEIPEPKISEKLQISEKELVFHLQRLRYVNEEFCFLANDYIPLKICPNLINADFSQASLLKTLQENNVIPHREEKIIEFMHATPTTAAYLNLKKGDPISVTRIITYDKSGQIIQYATSKTDTYKSTFRITSTLQN